MTDEQIRIAVAKALGWRHVSGVEEKVDSFLWCHEQSSSFHYLLHYESDLDAMHDAELTIDGPLTDDSLWLKYVRRLHYMCAGKGERATARQRAEAFLRVKGLWKD